MNKLFHIIILTIITAALWTLSGCSSGIDSGSGSGADASSSSGPDAAQDDIAYNTAEIALEENPSTGYTWTVEQMLVETQDDGSESDSDVLTIADEYKDAASSGDQQDTEGELSLVGAAGTHTYYLTVPSDDQTEDSSGNAAQTVTVKFTYARSWEDTALYTVEYDFAVSAAGTLEFLEKRAKAPDESAAENMPEFPDPIMSRNLR